MKRFIQRPLLFLSLYILFFLPSKASHGDSEHVTFSDDAWYPALVRIEDESAVSSLEERGVNILRRRGDLLLCFIPSKSSATRSALPGISKIDRGRKVSPTLDEAIRWYDAGAIHSGAVNDTPYKGRGVVTGICDIGFDPTHITFRDAGGRSRVKRIVQYKENEGKRIVLESEEEIAEWRTDNPDNWHATHVAGIMAGAQEPYAGMAPESDIVITTSQLSDVGLLCGAEDILEYASSQGKRAVINMSMANFTGPHDGTSLFSQYLDMIAEEAVVVLSAGNAGNTAMSLPYTFTDTARSFKVAIYSTDWVQFDPYGGVDMWSVDATPFRSRFLILDSDTGTIVKEFPWQALRGGESFVVCSDPSLSSADGTDIVVYDADWGAIYEGWIGLAGEIDAENGRYHTLLQYNAHTSINSAGGPWARYVPVLELEGEPGCDVYVYADTQYSVLRQVGDGPVPGSLLSFSDLATGQNVISVGMSVNRNWFPRISGETVTTSDMPGTVSVYSSYSTLPDGRVMPLAVAPGHGVVSAMSNPFNETHPGAEPLCAETAVDGEKYYWAMNMGTSMSSPYVAGAIACWLEACPDLTSPEIIEIIAETNRHDYPEAENPRHGQGWFDAKEGLRSAIGKYAGLNLPPVSESGDTRLSISGRTLTLWNPTQTTTVLRIYDAAGKPAASWTTKEPLQDFSLEALEKGLYIAVVNNGTATLKFTL